MEGVIMRNLFKRHKVKKAIIANLHKINVSWSINSGNC